MDNNNNNNGGFEFPNSSSNNDQLITKEMLESLRNSANAPKRVNVPARRPGNSSPSVDFPKETSIDMSPEVSGDTIPVGNIRNEVSFPDSKGDAFGPVRKPSHVKIKDEADNEGFKDVKSRKKKLRKRIILGVVFGILGVVIGIVGFLLWYKHYLFSQMQHIEPTLTIVDESGNTVRIADLTQPTQHEIISEDHIHNFLLIGVDARTSQVDARGNSDVNVVMSIDDQAGTIKMISIARDCYAHIPGYRDQKINAAMALGGPDLLEATIEQCLRIEIDGYAVVNFYSLANVINAVGGVYIDVSSSELYNDHGLNMCLDELGLSQYAIYTPGYIWVNGEQAVAYGRIRYVDSDYKRSERQVEVLRSLLDVFMGKSAAEKLAVIPEILSMISTNISEDEVTDYVVNFLPSMNNAEIQYMQLPIIDPDDSSNKCFASGMYGDEWSIRPNWNAEIPFVQEFFYGEQTVFDEVEPISGEPSLDSCPTPDTLPIDSLLK